MSKTYKIFDHPKDRLTYYLTRGAVGSYSEIQALHPLSFSVPKGETVGILGKNGSGKSTLLQIISGTLEPTTGEIETNGRVGALLELGSGFHGSFTGRENVYLNASLLGLSKKEIENKLDAILNFSEIGHFFDKPVRTYSSGMLLRLAFAVQAQVEPEILIIDEAIAVGDVKFQAKCFERIRQLKSNGTTILLVTHSIEQVTAHCDRVILLEQGLKIFDGEPRKAANIFMDILFSRSSSKEKRVASSSAENSTLDELHKILDRRPVDLFATRKNYNHNEYRWGDKKVNIEDFHFSVSSSNYPPFVNSGNEVFFSFTIGFLEAVNFPIFGFTIKNIDGITVYGTNTEVQKDTDFRQRGEKGERVQVGLTFLVNLAPGDYFVSVGVASSGPTGVVPHDRRYDSIHFAVRSINEIQGLVDLNLRFNAIEKLGGGSN